MAHRISIIEECKQEIYAGLEITREEALALVVSREYSHRPHQSPCHSDAFPM